MATAVYGADVNHPVMQLMGEQLVLDFVNRYGADGRVLFKGGFSLIFGVNDEWLLRVAIVTSAPVVLNVASALVSNFNYVLDIGRDLMPETDAFEANMLDAPGHKYHVFTVTRMRRVHAAAPAGIVRAFGGSHKAVLQALLQTGIALRRAGIVHRDMSQGNILFDGERFVFIDADNACLLPASFTCTEGQGTFTPGYVHWEAESDPNIRTILAKLSQDVTGIGHRLENEPPMYAYSPLMLEHQMTHGLISTALAICFNARASVVYNLVANTSDAMRANPDFQGWHYYLGIANTLDVSQRFTLDTALEATAYLSDVLPVHTALGGLLQSRPPRSGGRSSGRGSRRRPTGVGHVPSSTYYQNVDYGTEFST